ncbi:MAG: tetratricopeptide repeat protein, partial [Planctomycetota bacterium]|nr:tetratricopeptide repeat protein [Planctomycetota bacterium]
ANMGGADLRLGLLAALAVALLPCLHVWSGPELFGPRFLYLPLLFLAPWLHLRLGERLQSPKVALSVAILVSLGLARSVDVQAAGFHSPKAYWSERVRHNPEDARAHNGLGNIWLQEGEAGVSQATTLFQRSIELDPNYSRPHVGLAILARRSMDPAAERLHLEKALGLAPGNPVAWANLGSLHLRRKRPQDAVRAYLKATGLQPGRAAFWRGLARAQWDCGSPVEARASIRKAMELDPGDALNAQWQQRIAPD